MCQRVHACHKERERERERDRQTDREREAGARKQKLKEKRVHFYLIPLLLRINYLTTEKQTTKFSSAIFQKNVKSKPYHIENSKTRGQTV